MSKVYLAVKNPVLKGGNHYITLDYGYTYKNGSFHKGIDLVASAEANKGADYIIAFADGKVTSAVNTFSGQTTETSTTASMGNYVIIDHGNGITSLYGHASKLVVKVGDTVNQGDIIMKAGSTGYSTGPHLHFEVRKNGTPQDPKNYLDYKDVKFV